MALSKIMTLIAAILLLASCHKESPRIDSPEVALFSLGDSTVTMADVMRQIPEGLDPSDSARLFNEIIDRCISDYLLEKIALQNLTDPTTVERRVADYRRRLIIEQYLTTMCRSRRTQPSEDSIKAYYDANADHLQLERPIVKGLLIKLPADASGLDDVRRWVSRASASSIDKLEKYGLRGALQYDYFLDRWVDWSEVADQIPYSFGNADAFIDANPMFETENRGQVYLLRITDHLSSGQQMPFEFARPMIEETLTAQSQQAIEKEMLQSLLNNAIESHSISAGAYDPVTRKFIQTNSN